MRDPNLGGTVEVRLGLGEARAGLAHRRPRRRAPQHTPAGLLIHFGGKIVYHLGDTALFSDLQLVAQARDPIDVALCASAATTRWTATTRSRRPS